MNLVDRMARVALAGRLHEETVEISAYDSVTGSYTVVFRGVSVGPVWSVNNVRHAAGKTVTALVKNGQIVGLVP